MDVIAIQKAVAGPQPPPVVRTKKRSLSVTELPLPCYTVKDRVGSAKCVTADSIFEVNLHRSAELNMIWAVTCLLLLRGMGWSTDFVLPNRHSGERLELLLANVLGIHHGFHSSRIWDGLCVQFDYSLTLLLEWVAYTSMICTHGVWSWWRVSAVCRLHFPVLVPILELFDYLGNFWFHNHSLT